MFLSKILLKRQAPYQLLMKSAACQVPQFFSQQPRFNFSYKPTAAKVKDLRNLTGSPLKDCMAVLIETEGDIS